MNLSESNSKALLLDIHDDIELYANNATSIIFSSTNESLTYPPNIELTGEEIQALNNVIFSDNLKSALKKIIADNSANVVFNLLNNIDGTTDPKRSDDWTGVRLIDADENYNNEETENFLHDEFYSIYWDWKDDKSKL
jgi:hypothetical protein